MRHPTWSFELPGIVADIVWLLQADPHDRRSGWERAIRALDPLPDPDDLFLQLAYGEAFEGGRELHYPGIPFELVPLFWNGGDALHYGLVWYDERLGPEHPCAASYAPSEDGPLWLGDDVADGIRNLLAHYMEQRDANAEGVALAAALGLDLDGAVELEPGARSDRDHEPLVPLGWHFEPGSDGVGTLAPRGTFSGRMLADHGWEIGGWLEDGERELREGFAGSALAAFREAFGVAHHEGDPARAAEAMARAYDTLGRAPLAARARRFAAIRQAT